MRRSASVLIALLAAGCLADDASSPATCQARLLPGDVPADAPQEGGRGERAITIDVGPGPGAVATAWWAGAANGTVEVVRLRSAGSSVLVHAPANVPIGLLAAPERTAPRWDQALTLPAGPGDAKVALTDTLHGTIAGTWTEPVSVEVGPQGQTASWQPHDLPDVEANVARVATLLLSLAWQNGAAGGADFGIGVAHGSGFNYVNQGYQATPGPQTEQRDLDGQALVGLGWGNGTRAQAGPSMSTGGFATTGIAYTLTWTAELVPLDGSEGDVCDRLGPVREVDVTQG